MNFTTNCLVNIVSIKIDGVDLELQSRLLMTGNRYLEESNSWHDVYWAYAHVTIMLAVKTNLVRF